MADANPKALPDKGDVAVAPKKKSKAKKIIIIFLLLIIILTALGGGLYWWLYLRDPNIPLFGSEDKTTIEKTKTNKADSTAKKDSSPRIERQSDLPRSTGLVLPLPPFVVNLSDPSGKRYLKLGMEVEVNRDVESEIKKQSAKIRDAVIILLAGKTFADVSSAEGKILLKAEVASRLNQILGGPRVVRVYFTEFVVE